MFEMLDRTEIFEINSCYMNPVQLEYFRNKLLSLKADIEKASDTKIKQICVTDSPPIEDLERSSMAVDVEIAIQTRIIHTNMLKKIERALERIKSGTYGYCLETEEPIGLARLEANPVSEYCLSAQKKIEMMEKRRKTMAYEGMRFQYT